LCQANSPFCPLQHVLAKLRAELEGRREKLYKCCKRFGHLAQNCRNKKEAEKGVTTSQNKFKVLSNRVMQCEVEGKEIRRQEEVRRVECFKYREEEHKCREYPLWKEIKKRRVEERVAYMAMPQKVQQME